MWRWYLIYTKPQGEVTARSNLQRQGYETYLPCLLHSVRRKQPGRQQVSPLFPRYLFLHLDEGRQSLKPVHSTLGVTVVVRFGSQYAIVPDEIITSLRMWADTGSGLHRLNSHPSLAHGMSVRIAEGPLKGLEGVFERKEGSDRVLILLTLLGHDAHVRVLMDVVEPTNCAA